MTPPTADAVSLAFFLCYLIPLDLLAEILRGGDVAATQGHPGGGGDGPEVRVRKGEPGAGGCGRARGAQAPGAVPDQIRPHEVLPYQGCKVIRPSGITLIVFRSERLLARRKTIVVCWVK